MPKTLILELYKAHQSQFEMHNSRTRFRVGAWGRQAGKSTWAINELLLKAHDVGVYWFVSPTYSQALGQFRRLLWLLPQAAIFKYNQTELRLQLINGSVIRFVSGEVFDNLRGETLKGVIIDEVRDQHPDLWPMVIRPMLATTRGWAAFVSTPNGFDSFFDLAETARLDTTGSWSLHKAPSTANPLFTREEYERLKLEMSEGHFAQEILAEFRDLTQGRAYHAYGPWNERLDSPFAPGNEYSPHLPIIVALDFNLSPMSWAIGQNRGLDSHFSDEIYLTGSHTEQAARELAGRLHKTGVSMEHLGCVLIGDATGKATQRSSNKSDYDIVCMTLDRLGVRWQNQTPEANPSIRDRVNTLNARLKDGMGQARLTFNPKKCPMLKRDLERVTWKQGLNSDPKLDPGPKLELTHMSDAVGYAVAKLSPLELFGIGRMRVIVR